MLVKDALTTRLFMINLAASTQLCFIFCMTLNHRGILEAEYVVFTGFYILESEQILGAIPVSSCLPFLPALCSLT